MSVGFVVKPLINGLRRISSMPARSAPSAKSLTLSVETDVTMLPPLGPRGSGVSRPIPRVSRSRRNADRPHTQPAHSALEVSDTGSPDHMVRRPGPHRRPRDEGPRDRSRYGAWQRSDPTCHTLGRARLETPHCFGPFIPAPGMHELKRGIHRPLSPKPAGLSRVACSPLRR